ncbi:hypothetical protein IGB42_00902 [Andreprevotia sp. IGB-42]|uniref:BPSS1780 family membrane protein n=1 Tax=Andreprevotia sp. IGB-42 TaxID=2497473 RepID=UPI00135CAB62|nr:BPSS1780 family membrane protein [Andreprevotia sp. IGB-42]KAF0814847.1 hypothetical protein IGB42_00902 [Andreprevotia sp. IGB-42]
MQTDDVIDTTLEPRTLPAMQGWRWISGAARLFGKHWSVFLPQSLLFLLLMIVCTFIAPLLVIWPALLAGVSYSVSRAAMGEVPRLVDLFAGFRMRTRPLLMLGMIYLLTVLLINLLLGYVSGVLGVEALMHAFTEAAKAGKTSVDLKMDMSALGYWMGAVVVCGIVLQNLFFFAAPLVMLNGATPGEAIRTGITAFWRNMLPLTVAGMIFFVLLVFASMLLPAMLLLVPVVMLFNYTCYADVFPVAPRSE